MYFLVYYLYFQATRRTDLNAAIELCQVDAGHVAQFQAERGVEQARPLAFAELVDGV
jgi:hypothetical protein